MCIDAIFYNDIILSCLFQGGAAAESLSIRLLNAPVNSLR